MLLHLGSLRLIMRVRESLWIGPYGEAEPNEGYKDQPGAGVRGANAEVILIALSAFTAWLTIGRRRHAHNALHAAIVLPAYLE